MNDEQVTEYLRNRHRGRFEPPLDAVSSVMAAVDAARPQRSWFAPPVLAAAVAGAAGVAIALALLIGPGRNVGPGPSASDPSISRSATPSASATASPTAVGEPLLSPGATAVLSATDSEGEWGTIRLERGDDLGGYRDAEIPPDTFIIEVFVTYDARRMPEPAQFGASDWVVRPADPAADGFFVAEAQTFERANRIGVRPAIPLGEYPGAIDIFTTPTEGRIAFAIPLRAAELTLELVYQPQASGPVFMVRAPGPAPEPVAVATPQPIVEPNYVEIDGLPFTVLDSAEADALLSRPDTCANPDEGYSVTFPDDWYTNTQTGAVAACSWFTPEFFEVTAPGQAPEEIWISIGVIDGVVGYTGLTEVYYGGEVRIDGRDGHRNEYNPDRNTDPDYRAYRYVVPLGDNGPTLVASTDTDTASDYPLAKAVLDRIMASFTFED